MEASKPARHVVITGAAGALGRAVASRFAGEGARLALIDHSLQHLQSVFAHPEPDHGGHLLHAADVTSDAAMAPVAAAILDAFGSVDVLVHVAGGFEMGEPTHALSRESWTRMMDLNAWSFVAVTGHFIPAMMFQRSGKVIAVTARAASTGAATMAAYIASKSALQRLVECLSHEVRAAGINVNSIAPSILDTPANRNAMPKSDPANWVSTGTAARTIAFLASDAAQAMHGQHIVLDGLS
ncbi:SDR family NAD(P)-dependent oxidoreductase [Cupriavidus plantarum]|uniref:Short-subunit dehydrogenase n=1 Tax=Cupriavidus plantarum TaxID=942865 RepID=A0A316ET13_9BURK|nr:SDR family oxidoreductase [Cupriavidus plantarum]NYI00726.1 NAD(P)-dependent dehydrogenase (short-subunit alcohol dehydrogenase family) [Cupriavidus plantarum]PWK35136.1 short-subunit dehydrogenase [Cupriavidus plantarum]RLK39004.1 short-subunit dehydrogenase [Cupriavidus plantarum]